MFTIPIEGTGSFSLDDTLDCGQCFHWERNADGSWSGSIRIQDGSPGGDGSTYATIRQVDRSISFIDHPAFHSDEETEAAVSIWREYFDLDTDYDAVQRILAKDPVCQKAIAYCGGIRILRQDGWEALASFILSQNNNIPRIKGMIDRLCEAAGPLLGTRPDGRKIYGFPSPRRIVDGGAKLLEPVRAGFRTRYLLDAAYKVASGEVDLDFIRTAPIDEARNALQKIMGVGPKVADCALLYGFYRLEAFPVDVWVRRVLSTYYPDGLPACFSAAPGFAQQYLFHYIRTCPEAKDVSNAG